MAELLVSSRGRNNYAGNGRRIYADSNELAEMQVQDWVTSDKLQAETQARVPWEAQTYKGNRNQASFRRGRQVEEEERVKVCPDDRQEVGDEIRREGKGNICSDQREDIRQAASLLLATAGGVLFADLCESCASVLQDRLASIASGQGLSALSTDSFANLRPASSGSGADGPNGTLDAEGLRLNSHSHDPLSDNASLSEDSVENCHTGETVVGEPPSTIVVTEDNGRGEAIMKKDDGSRQGFRQELTVENRRGSTATGANGSATNLLIKSALNDISIAPARRTRSMSRQAGLLQTPHQNSETANDNGESASILKVKRKKDFCLLERVNGRVVNILQGLELHCNVFNSAEQKELIQHIYGWQELGRNQKLRRRTYSEPRKWMRGKGRVTIQFGCCYNYAVDKDGNPPGIIQDEEVDEIPSKLRMVIKRLVQWQVLPPSCVPDSCIINIYDVGDCIPPHIDHHDFVRPFCTLSLLSECDIIFGTNLKIAGPGEFKGSFSVPLPTGSVLILNGNGADVAKHAVPAVPNQRISITFRKMDPTKVPYSFRPDKELLSTQPLTNGTVLESREAASLPHSAGGQQVKNRISEMVKSKSSEVVPFSLDSDFPALRGPVLATRQGNLRS